MRDKAFAFFKHLANYLRKMLTDALSAIVNNPFKESFMRKGKKQLMF